MPDPDPVPYTEDFDMDNPIDDFDDFENEGEDLGDGDEKLEENVFANADPALAAATGGTIHRVVTPTAFTILPWLAASAMVRTTFPSTSLQHNCYRRVSNALKRFFQRRSWTIFGCVISN